MSNYPGLVFILSNIRVSYNLVSSLLIEISVFAQKEASRNFFQLLVTQEDRNTRINGYHRKIVAMIETFQVSHITQYKTFLTEHFNKRYHPSLIKMKESLEFTMLAESIRKP